MTPTPTFQETELAAAAAGVRFAEDCAKRDRKEEARLRLATTEALVAFRHDYFPGHFKSWVSRFMPYSTATRWMRTLAPRPNPREYCFRDRYLVIAFNPEQEAELHALLAQVQQLEANFDFADWLVRDLSRTVPKAARTGIANLWEFPVDIFRAERIAAYMHLLRPGLFPLGFPTATPRQIDGRESQC